MAARVDSTPGDVPGQWGCPPGTIGPMETDELAPGMLLAAPSLHDPNFERTVVLLGRSGGEGALGWVINGRELMSVRELLTSAELVPAGVTVPRTAVFSR